ncbi:MAG: 50S ribosomal protein L19 [Planctomycetes bacterium]|nr:50S ribosomal protein L19 [Planctomycetota bacterium]
MRNRLIEGVEKDRMRKSALQFDIGDTVSVGVKIIEGNKERVQPFIGTVIARKGGGLNETFTVRRIVNNEGVERTFPMQSPRIAGVEVVRHGKVRRAKLYYLRERVGKARKLRERRAAADEGVTDSAPAEGAPVRSRRPAAEPEAVATV